MTKPILVRKLKYDGSVRSEWEGELLPFDSAEWLIVRHHPERHRKWQDGKQARADILMVRCLNIVKPSTILLGFDANGQFDHAKCDAALPSVYTNNLLEFVDLDLDIIVNSDLTFYVRDQAQFEQHRVLMNYPDEVVEQAHLGIAIAKTWVQSRAFPFNKQLVPHFNL